MSTPRHRAGGVLAANPVLVGAVTVLTTVVAVFMAYNANQGLPFVPTYSVSALVPNADALLASNEVRIGGIQVGRVEAIEPETLAGGRVVARVDMKLNPEVEPLPVDSTFTVRNRSAVGLKYLQIRPGEAREGFEPTATMPLSAYEPETVELDDLLNVFDDRTRSAAQGNLAGFGTALAGRGPELNQAFQALSSLLETARPVTKNLAARGTRFGDFWRALAATAAEVAPVADIQAALFRNLDVTFAAFAEVAEPYIGDTIEQSPPTLDEATTSLPIVRPFLRHSTEFLEALQPGARALARTSPTITAALETGARVLPDAPGLNAQLAPTAAALVDLQEAPGALHGLELLQQTNAVADPTLRFLTPAQATCNYLTILFGNVGGAGSSGDDIGHWTRAVSFGAPKGPNSEGSPSSAPASGGEVGQPPAYPGRDALYLHSNPYPNTAAPGQPRECEAGNEKWTPGQTVVGNMPGNQGTKTKGQGSSR